MTEDKREFSDQDRWQIHAALDELLSLHAKRDVDAYRVLDETYTKSRSAPRGEES